MVNKLEFVFLIPKFKFSRAQYKFFVDIFREIGSGMAIASLLQLFFRGSYKQQY